MPIEHPVELNALQSDESFFAQAQAEQVKVFGEFLSSTSKYLEEQKCVLPNIPFLSMPDLNMSPKTCEHAEKVCALAIEQSLKSTQSYAASNYFSNPCGAGTQLSDAYLFRSSRENFLYAEKRFSALTQNSELQTRCCGQDLVCKKKWSETRLEVLLGLGTLDQASFNLATSSVRVSSAKIAGCLTEGCIDRIFFHELGHACQSGKALVTADDMLADLSRSIGKKGISCLESSLNSRLNKMDKKSRAEIATLQWTKEAYADLIFADEWDMSGIVSACAGLPGSDHAGTITYLGCMLKYEPKLNKRFCTGAP